jgi:hypothetical protein
MRKIKVVVTTTPSKQERHRVYKRLLQLYKSDPYFNVIERDWLGFQHFETCGLCSALRELYWTNKKTDTNIRVYPELMQDKFNPEKHFWDLHEHGYLQRVMLILEAIEKTRA